jgi:predicted transglutaminase-like protease
MFSKLNRPVAFNSPKAKNIIISEIYKNIFSAFLKPTFLNLMSWVSTQSLDWKELYGQEQALIPF